MESLRASVIFSRFSIRAEAQAVISATSRGCSAMMGRAPTASSAFAQSLIEIGFVMQ